MSGGGTSGIALTRDDDGVDPATPMEVWGTQRNDFIDLRGNSAGSAISGMGGQDTLYGGSGDDIFFFTRDDLLALEGDSIVDGGDGTDILFIRDSTIAGGEGGTGMSDDAFSKVSSVETLMLMFNESHNVTLDTQARGAGIVSVVGGNEGNFFSIGPAYSGQNLMITGGSYYDVFQIAPGAAAFNGAGLSFTNIGYGDSLRIKADDTGLVDLTGSTLSFTDPGLYGSLNLGNDAGGQRVAITADQRSAFASVVAHQNDQVFISELAGRTVAGTAATDFFVFGASDAGVTITSFTAGAVAGADKLDFRAFLGTPYDLTLAVALVGQNIVGHAAAIGDEVDDVAGLVALLDGGASAARDLFGNGEIAVIITETSGDDSNIFYVTADDPGNAVTWTIELVGVLVDIDATDLVFGNFAM